MEKECSHPSDVIFTVLVIQVGGCKQAMNMIILQLYPYSTNANMHSWLLRLHTSWYDIHWPIHGTSISVVSGLLHTWFETHTMFTKKHIYMPFHMQQYTTEAFQHVQIYVHVSTWLGARCWGHDCVYPVTIICQLNCDSRKWVEEETLQAHRVDSRESLSMNALTIIINSQVTECSLEQISLLPWKRGISKVAILRQLSIEIH